VRKILIAVLALIASSSCAIAQEEENGSIMVETRKYVESLEWDVAFHEKTEQYASYKKVYLSKLASDSSYDIFLSSVMLGSLKAKEALPQLKNIPTDDDMARIGIAFAQCALGYDCKKNVEYLMAMGKTTQLAGRAMSLKYLEPVELLSLLEIEGFLDYAGKLKTKTEEVYQREAIAVAIHRHKRIYP
jgi:hypothetical protein